jgi:ABC-type Fe3+ transport system substrate-binding protein
MRGRFPLLITGSLIGLISTPFTPSASAADPALIAAAQKEGKVVWYSTQQVDPLMRPIAAAFEKKYGIHVDYVRADSNDVALRIYNEGEVNRMQADIFDGTAAVAALKKEHMVERWLPDDAKRLPASDIDAEGYWVAANLYVITAAYNTGVIPPGSEPKNWNDLLNPKWKNQMFWSTAFSGSAGPGFVGLVLTKMGQEKGMEYLRALAKQNIAGAPLSAREILNQVISQEYSIGLQVYNHAAALSAKQGAPIKWIPMSPSLVDFNVVALTAGAPHPNAGKLLEDFIISPEGQEIYAKADLLVVDPNVQPFDPTLRPDGKNFSVIIMTPEEIDENMPAWSKTFDELFN